jgi:hypothetical protein
MRVLTARNVHEALPLGLKLLYQEGVRRDSRNGPVLVAPFPVTTVYERPCERVLFWPERDANPFFHLYESLWMLDGRRDVAGVVKYAKNMANFSDDGENFHGAYGARWLDHFAEYIPAHKEYEPMNQLSLIIEALKANVDDRRSVLSMWDPSKDLGRQGKDLPCNLTATFQRGSEGELNLTVFNRSNDIVWGAYGANAVHFSVLLEYMALAIGCLVGTYRQVSVNWHGYLSTLAGVENLRDTVDKYGYVPNPYESCDVYSIPMGSDFAIVQREISRLLSAADSGLMTSSRETRPNKSNAWAYNVHLVLEAHEAFRKVENGIARYVNAMFILQDGDPLCDWIVAAKEWIGRRAAKAGFDISPATNNGTKEPQSGFYPHGSKL